MGHHDVFHLVQASVTQTDIMTSAVTLAITVVVVPGQVLDTVVVTALKSGQEADDRVLWSGAVAVPGQVKGL